MSKTMIERLRGSPRNTSVGKLDHEAADRIEELERENSDYSHLAGSYLARAKRAEQESDKLREQVNALKKQLLDNNLLLDDAADKIDEFHINVAWLRDGVTRCRDWFERQEKLTSKGGPSSWEFMLLRDERNAAEEVLAATEPKK